MATESETTALRWAHQATLEAIEELGGREKVNIDDAARLAGEKISQMPEQVRDQVIKGPADEVAQEGGALRACTLGQVPSSLRLGA